MSISTATYFVLAQMPGQNIQPQAPSEFATKFDRLLNLAMYIGIGVAIIGVIVAGASMVLSRQQGTSEEATAMALRIGIGSMIIGGAAAIVAAML
ncbi:hypothetical protein [Corynebacterium senegalense]|uniref:hypothetical protein n=1 Tax=Corynebacterium senegalense TaxID=2080750 RepID=UPI000E1FB88D|nr:hypothetical protein [Corynebacterium senegalense]